jgi:hypothetical protein
MDEKKESEQLLLNFHYFEPFLANLLKLKNGPNVLFVCLNTTVDNQ